MVTREDSRPVGAERRLTELGLELPQPPKPFGTDVEAVQTGNQREVPEGNGGGKKHIAAQRQTSKEAVEGVSAALRARSNNLVKRSKEGAWQLQKSQ
jgi:hypothetical protein